MHAIELSFHGEYAPQALQATLGGFQGEQDFFVLQVGAMDGVTFDPIHEALTAYGWPALRLEPQPEYHKVLVGNCRYLPRVTCLCRAIAEHTGTALLHRVPPEPVLAGDVAPWLGGTASLYPERNLLGGWRRAGASAETIDYIERQRCTISVPCSTLPDLIAEYALSRIDMVVIDAEGADWMILRQFDLQRFRPRLILFEFYNLPNQEGIAALAHLTSHGYQTFISSNRADVLALAA